MDRLMIYSAVRLIRKYPTLALLVTGLWTAASPWLIVSILNLMRSRGILPATLDTFLSGLGSRTDLPFAIVFYSGLGLAAAAAGWMAIRVLAHTFRRFPI
jgi:hypothetical protein